MEKFTVAPTSDPHVAVPSDQAAGELTFTLNAGEHINLQTLEVTQGHFTITSTTGDKVIGTYKGMAHMIGIPNVIEYDVTGLMSGSTGKFEGAAGAMVCH